MNYFPHLLRLKYKQYEAIILSKKKGSDKDLHFCFIPKYDKEKLQTKKERHSQS